MTNIPTPYTNILYPKPQCIRCIGNCVCPTPDYTKISFPKPQCFYCIGNCVCPMTTFGSIQPLPGFSNKIEMKK